jgi:outer membrane protein insertion porin family
MAPAGRAAIGKVCLTAALAIVTLGSLLAPTQPAVAAPKGDGLPEGNIAEIKVEGNVSISSEQVKAKLLSKPGRPLQRSVVDADLRTLLGTKWFSDVTPYVEELPNKKGYVLIFHVKEMPVLTSVEFRGMEHLKLKDVQETTGLKKGNRADATRTRLAVGQIQRLYAEKGYDMAEVYLVEGGNRGDTKVVIQIFEGPKFRVRNIDFKGNTFASDAMLRTKVTSRTPILGFGGKFQRETLDEDIRKLTEYYQGQGFFEVRVTPVTRNGSGLGDLQITFVISEGTRYKVRNIIFEGNKKLTTAKLKSVIQMKSGEPILETVREADKKGLVRVYNEIGCIKTQILPEQKYTDQPGVVDIVYKIEEGEPFLLGELIIKGNERTKDKVIRREADMAAVLPGQVLNLNRIELYKNRLGNLGYFHMSPEMGKPIEVRIVNERKQPYSDGTIPEFNDGSLTRMQDPGADPPVVPAPIEAAPGGGPGLSPFGAGAGLGGAAAPPRGGNAGAGLSPFGAGGAFDPPSDLPPIEVPPAANTLPPSPMLPPGRGAAPTTPPVGAGEPPGMEPSIPGMNMTDVGPDRQDPFPNRSFADVVTSVNEAPTGRFMLGVGASGYQGLSGTLTVNEKNFDLFNPPRSFEDIANGKAFRGGGQNFQLQLMAGTLMNRVTASISNPYLFDLPIGGNATGYVYQRLYPDWDETRGGGRFSLGRQFGTSTYADVAFRIEDVNFYGYRIPAPASYLAAAGHTTLASIRPTLRFDNRNSPFMPNKGQFVEFSFEQGWGTFTYPKVEVEGRTYFTTGSRPDGSGPRILAFRGHFGVTGQNTPVYERFYAGYLGSLRGFQYRGVGPHVLGANVGGVLMSVGSVEYMFPLTASDSVRQVIFCDFGTVEGNYDFNNFRVAVGTGLRITIPQFGPLPLCFDLGFPLAKAPGDKTNIFAFSIGAFY